MQPSCTEPNPLDTKGEKEGEEGAKGRKKKKEGGKRRAKKEGKRGSERKAKEKERQKRKEGKRERKIEEKRGKVGGKAEERGDFYKKIGFCKFLLGLYKRILEKKVYICNIRNR